MGLSLGELFVNVTARTAAFYSNMRGVSSSLQSTGRAAQSLGRTITTAVTAPIALSMGAAGRWGHEFNKSFELTNTMMKQTGHEADAFKRRVLEMSDTYGKSSADIMASGYKVTSVLHTNAEDTATILEATTQAAKAGKISTEQATNAIVNSMSIYGVTADKTMQVADMLAATVREGNASWADMADVLPRVYGMAKPLGMSMEEGAAAFATMSSNAANASEAATGTIGVINALLTPTDAMRGALTEIAQKYGVVGKATAKNIIQQKGFGTVMKELDRIVAGDTDKLTELIPGIRGISGASGLMTKSAAALEGALRGVKNSAGEVQAQIDAGRGPAERLTESFNRIRNAGIRAWLSIEPLWVGLAESAGNAALAFSKFSEPIQRLLTLSAGVVALIGPVIAMGGTALVLFGKIGTAISGFGGALGILKSIGALIGSLLSPTVLIVGTILALGGAIAYSFGLFDGVGEKVSSLVGMVRGFAVSAIESFHSFVAFAIGYFQNFSENTRNIIGWLGDNWANLLSDMVQIAILATLNLAKNFLVFAQKASGIWGVLIGYLSSEWSRLPMLILEVLLSAAVKVGEVAQRIGKAIWKGIKTALKGGEYDPAEMFTGMLDSFDKGKKAAGSFADRIKAIDLFGGWVGPLEGFKSSVTDMPKLKLGSEIQEPTKDAMAKVAADTEKTKKGMEGVATAAERLSAKAPNMAKFSADAVKAVMLHERASRMAAKTAEGVPTKAPAVPKPPKVPESGTKATSTQPTGPNVSPPKLPETIGTTSAVPTASVVQGAAGTETTGKPGTPPGLGSRIEATPSISTEAGEKSRTEAQQFRDSLIRIEGLLSEMNGRLTTLSNNLVGSEDV